MTPDELVNLSKYLEQAGILSGLEALFLQIVASRATKVGDINANHSLLPPELHVIRDTPSLQFTSTGPGRYDFTAYVDKMADFLKSYGAGEESTILHFYERFSKVFHVIENQEDLNQIA